MCKLPPIQGHFLRRELLYGKQGIKGSKVLTFEVLALIFSRY